MIFRLIGAAALALALSCGLCGSQAHGQAVADDKSKSTEDSTTVNDLLGKGLEHAQKGEMTKAAELIEKAIKLDPKNRQGLFFLGAIQQDLAEKAADRAKKNELILKSAENLRTLYNIDKSFHNPREKALFTATIYNEACVYAFTKKDDKAIASLNEAVDAGFTDAKTLANDEDLVSLRKRPDFAALSTKMELVAKKELAELVLKIKGELKDFKSFPFTFDLPDLEDKSVKLADFKGKVTIVDVWGTWCPPCREEIPHFIDLIKKYQDKGLAIVGINYERAEKSKWKPMISSFITENHINYPCVIGDEKTQEMIPEFQGYPTTLFIDREGKVRYKLVGAAPTPVLESIVTVLLDEPAAKKSANP